MFTVSAMYHFVPLQNLPALQKQLKDFCEKKNIRGTLLLASEGINGTVAGQKEDVEALLAHLRSLPEFAALEDKKSFCEEEPFRKMKVRLKKEIVNMGVPGVDPNHLVGTYVPPLEWNQLIADPNVILVDTRNSYEFEVGTFANAVDPKTRVFSQFPEYVEKNLSELKDKKIAMFCTGGIRCEKATSFMKEKGFENVYHLQGGILKYLEEVPEEESLWHGDCYTFDHRVSVKHGLKPGDFQLCHACGDPLSPADRELESFQAGISCKHCIGKKREDQIRGYQERQRQVELQKQREKQE